MSNANSVAAVKAVKITEQQQEVLSAIRLRPSYGLSSVEFDEFKHRTSSAHRRIPELAALGLIEPKRDIYGTPISRPGPNGRKSRVWVPVAP